MTTTHHHICIDGYDDESHDRYVEYEIVYSFTPGYWDSTGIRDFWIDAEIYVKSVQVLHIEFFEPKSGCLIAKVERAGINPAALTVLDQLALERVDNDINIGGPLSEQLAEAATS